MMGVYQMKKLLLMLLIFWATILLAGCISIPLGDGEKLTIGFNGINIEADDAEENMRECQKDVI